MWNHTECMCCLLKKKIKTKQNIGGVCVFDMRHIFNYWLHHIDKYHGSSSLIVCKYFRWIYLSPGDSRATYTRHYTKPCPPLCVYDYDNYVCGGARRSRWCRGRQRIPSRKIRWTCSVHFRIRIVMLHTNLHIRYGIRSSTSTAKECDLKWSAILLAREKKKKRYTLR